MRDLLRVSLAHLPTPIEELTRLSEALGGPPILVKRDDLTGLAFGGNKTRKLEYLAAAARAESADTLITAGAVQSNHCRQTAAAAARLGMACTLVLAGEKPKQASANILLDGLMGADLIWASPVERDAALQATFDRYKAEGRRPYLVPYGGSNPLGAAAYAYALREVLEQGLLPEWIVFASSSGGTQAGLVAGAKMLNYSGKILGISVDERAVEMQSSVADLASQTAALLGEPAAFKPGDILISDEYLGGGYAVMGEAEKEGIRLFASHEGLMLDPVYTGRAAAGLIDLVRNNFFDSDDTVLFWHTGGTPALFADAFHSKLISDD
jgi:D-cysteine desulfhydrase family pyridoxal phosphate-dependent enzyme